MEQSQRGTGRDTCDAVTIISSLREKRREADLIREKEALLGSSYRSYGSNGAAEGGGGVPAIKIYKSRFWMLISFSLLCLVHDIVWIIWGPISESMNAAFPGWGPSTVAMMVNWGTIIYSLFFIPICWAAQRYGLRASVVTSAAVLASGSALRCITSTTPAFTILCHMSGVAVGLAAPVILSAPTLIASDWFPVQERTTAMAIMVGMHQFGGVFDYLEPLLVRMPAQGVTQADIQHDVMRLVYITTGLAAVLLIAVVVYFPSKPPSSPSLTSSEERIMFLPAVKALIKNKKFMLLLVCYGIFMGPPIAWLTVINFSLLPLGLHQDKAMWVGIIAVFVSSVFPILMGRVNDLLQGHTKTLLIALMTTTTIAFYWFLLMSYGVLPITDWQVYLSAVGGVACSYGALPLFLEIAIDLVYPVPELLVTAVMIAADNLVGAAFLLLFNIPDEKHLWATYTLTLCSSLTTVPLVAVSFPSTRADIDMG